MPTSVVYKGSADRRVVTRGDLEKTGAKSFANDFKDLVFLKNVPQDINKEYADILLAGEHFAWFEEPQGDEEPTPEILTDKVAAKTNTKVVGTGSGTGSASAGTSSSTGSDGATSASTGR